MEHARTHGAGEKRDGARVTRRARADKQVWEGGGQHTAARHGVDRGVACSQQSSKLFACLHMRRAVPLRARPTLAPPLYTTGGGPQERRRQQQQADSVVRRGARSQPTRRRQAGRQLVSMSEGKSYVGNPGHKHTSLAAATTYTPNDALPRSP